MDVMEEQESSQNCMQEIAALISAEEYSDGMCVQMFMNEIMRYAAIMEFNEKCGIGWLTPYW